MFICVLFDGISRKLVFCPQSSQLPIQPPTWFAYGDQSTSVTLVLLRVKGTEVRHVFACSYLQQLHERNVLAAALEMRALEFMHMPVRSVISQPVFPCFLCPHEDDCRTFVKMLIRYDLTLPSTH